MVVGWRKDVGCKTSALKLGGRSVGWMDGVAGDHAGLREDGKIPRV